MKKKATIKGSQLNVKRRRKKTVKEKPNNVAFSNIAGKKRKSKKNIHVNISEVVTDFKEIKKKRSESAKKGWETRRRNQKKERYKKRVITEKKEIIGKKKKKKVVTRIVVSEKISKSRSEAAKKGWETRRRNQYAKQLALKQNKLKNVKKQYKDWTDLANWYLIPEKIRDILLQIKPKKTTPSISMGIVEGITEAFSDLSLDERIRRMKQVVETATTGFEGVNKAILLHRLEVRLRSVHDKQSLSELADELGLTDSQVYTLSIYK